MHNNKKSRKIETGPKWKRELAKEHKFDNIDLEALQNNNCITMLRYLFLLCSIIISFLAYIADLWTAVTLLVYDKWSLSKQPIIPFYISKWIYVGCIILSFMLLAWEIRNAVRVMDTRDVSLAVTNPLACRTYSVKGYHYFCLLRKIKSSTKWSDVIIFYVFYTLKGWKKVIVAQSPRQIIAGMTAYAILYSAWSDQNGHFHFVTDWDVYGSDWQQRVTLILMCFTCLLWLFSALSIALAVFLYFFVLCQIQGNLKEYCCHKIDKRINEILAKYEKSSRLKLERNQTYVQHIALKRQDTDMKPDKMEKSTTPIIKHNESYRHEDDETQIWEYYNYHSMSNVPQPPNEMDYSQSYFNHHNHHTPIQPEASYDWRAQSNQISNHKPDDYAYHYSDNYNYSAYEPAPNSTPAAYDYHNNLTPSHSQANYLNHQPYSYYKN